MILTRGSELDGGKRAWAEIDILDQLEYLATRHTKAVRMAYRLASLLAIAGPALALSSHSPIDLESYPAYAVSFSEHQPILNETLGEILSEPLQVSQ